MSSWGSDPAGAWGAGLPQKRVCEAILGDLRIVRRQGVSGVVLEIFSRDQQVMGLLLPDAGPAQLLGFDDRTMILRAMPRTGKPRSIGTAINCAVELASKSKSTRTERTEWAPAAYNRPVIS